MMRIRWSPASAFDLARLYEFLANVAPRAAARNIDSIIMAAEKLPDYPRAGHMLENYLPRDVCSLIAGDYEVRYEIDGEWLIVLRVWHTREDR